MTLTSFDFTCVTPIKGGKAATPHFHLYVADARGSAGQIENLDLEDLAFLRDALSRFLEKAAPALGAAAPEGGNP